jgi:hypothetical protein
MHSPAVELFQMLVQAGAVPGEDFSCDGETQAFRLNDRCYDLLRQAYPEVYWDDVFTQDSYNPASEIALLHEYLGVPFVDRLLAQMQQRLQTLPDAQAAWYLHQLLAGIEQRTGLLLCPMLEAALSTSGQARLEWLLRLETGEPCNLWLLDLVTAAGGAESDVQLLASDCWLSDRALALLEMLWQGDLELALLPRS